MCLTKLNSAPIKPRVTRKSKTVYKILSIVNTKIDDKTTISFRSPYQRYMYTPGKLVEATIGQPQKGPYDTYQYHEGLHSFRTLEAAKKHLNENIVWMSLYASIPTLVIIECIIPEGSQYILGEKNEIISSKLIVTTNKCI